MGYYYANTAGCYVVSILLSALCSASVVWRFYLRKSQQLQLRLDDWLCIPALIFTLGCAIIIIIGTAQGAIGRNSDPRSGADVVFQFSEKERLSSKCGYALVALSYFALGFIKLSFLFFYRHIFRGKGFDIASWTTIFFVSLWMTISSIVYVFSCASHFSYLWSNFHDLQQCINIFNQILAGAVIDVFFDLVLLIMPLAMILKMHMPRKTTIAGCSVFLVASISIGAAVCRLVISASLDNVNTFREHQSILGVAATDEIALTSIQLFWTMIEMSVGLIAACLPCMGFFPLLHRMLSSLRSKLGFTSQIDEESTAKTPQNKRSGIVNKPVYSSRLGSSTLPLPPSSRNDEIQSVEKALDPDWRGHDEEKNSKYRSIAELE